MRRWTVHLKFPDAKGLVTHCRQRLLAKAVLEVKTIAYNNHPQLIRFRENAEPLEALHESLRGVFIENRQERIRQRSNGGICDE